MGPTEIILLLIFLGGLFIIGFALLIGANIGKKQNETRCPFCKEQIKKGDTECHWCGKVLPTEEKA